MSPVRSDSEERATVAQCPETFRFANCVTLTVNGIAGADIVPHRDSRSPWLHATELRQIVKHAGADAELLGDLAEVRNGLVGE
jgi:hypothetical protein